jgi:peptidoglycan/xylan/chitin deacetylase (PgdA/CDA1 family)
MRGKREQLAGLLDRAHVFDALLGLRARMRLPVLSVLCYHSIAETDPAYPFDDDVVDATPEEFRAQMEFLASRFTVISGEEAAAIVAGARIPPNPAVVTFDDGYRTCRDVALPILSRLGLPATFFIATDYVSSRRPFWWDSVSYLVKRSPASRIGLTYPQALMVDLADRPAAIARIRRAVSSSFGVDLPRFVAELAGAARVEWTADTQRELADRLIMTWDDVRAVHDAGMDIASHTRSHQVLRNLGVYALGDELSGSRVDIEREVEQPVHSVAYPVGYRISHIPRLRAAVQRAGYDIGYTNATGVNYLWRGVDRFDVRRLATARGASMAMFRGQLAFPPLAYTRST